MKVRSAKGELIDMGALAARNSTVVALGNAGMNARGDIVDKRGRVLKTRDVVVQEYYDSNPRAVTQAVSLRDLGEEVLTPQQAIAKVDAVIAARKNEINTDPKPKPRRKIVEKDD